MTRTRIIGVRRPRPGGTGLGAIVAVWVSALVCLLLLAALVPQARAVVDQAGRPWVDAIVVACPASLGSRGPCTVRVPRDGHDVQVSLDRSALLFPEQGDRLPVVLTDSGTAVPAGWRAWFAAGVLFGLLGAAVYNLLAWSRRVLDARAPELIEPLGPPLEPK